MKLCCKKRKDKNGQAPSKAIAEREILCLMGNLYEEKKKMEKRATIHNCCADKIYAGCLFKSSQG
jgi:hypothetical protein